MQIQHYANATVVSVLVRCRVTVEIVVGDVIYYMLFRKVELMSSETEPQRYNI